MNNNQSTHIGFRSLVKDIFAYANEFSQENEWAEFESLLERKDFKEFAKNINGFFTVFNYRNGHYEFMSDGICSHLGYEIETFLGPHGSQQIYNIIHEDHRRWFLDPILKDVLFYLSNHVTGQTGLDYRFSVSLKLKNFYDVYQWYILDTIVLQTEESGLPRRTLVTFTNIEQYKKDSLVYYNVMKKDDLGIYIPVFEKSINHMTEEIELTQRETEILSFIAQGLTSTEIASRLFISVSTVKTHRKNILSKTKCKGPVELANFAFSRGLL